MEITFADLCMSGSIYRLLKQTPHLCFEKTIVARWEVDERQREQLGGYLQMRQIRPKTVNECRQGGNRFPKILQLFFSYCWLTHSKGAFVDIQISFWWHWVLVHKQIQQAPTYKSSGYELPKMWNCVPSTSGVSKTAACPPSPVADDPSVLPSPTSSPSSCQ